MLEERDMLTRRQQAFVSEVFKESHTGEHTNVDYCLTNSVCTWQKKIGLRNRILPCLFLQKPCNVIIMIIKGIVKQTK